MLRRPSDPGQMGLNGARYKDISNDLISKSNPLAGTNPKFHWTSRPAGLGSFEPGMNHTKWLGMKFSPDKKCSLPVDL